MRANRIDVRLHGIEHAQYFQGAGVGVGSERADDVFVGCGASEREAVNDALECAAISGWEFDEPDFNAYSAEDVVGPYCAAAGVEPCDAEAYFYASVRVWGARANGGEVSR